MKRWRAEVTINGRKFVADKATEIGARQALDVQLAMADVKTDGATVQVFAWEPGPDALKGRFR